MLVKPITAMWSLTESKPSICTWIEVFLKDLWCMWNIATRVERLSIIWGSDDGAQDDASRSTWLPFLWAGICIGFVPVLGPLFSWSSRFSRFFFLQPKGANYSVLRILDLTRDMFACLAALAFRELHFRTLCKVRGPWMDACSSAPASRRTRNRQFVRDNY